jgi:hypothetical protein
MKSPCEVLVDMSVRDTTDQQMLVKQFEIGKAKGSRSPVCSGKEKHPVTNSSRRGRRVQGPKSITTESARQILLRTLRKELPPSDSHSGILLTPAKSVHAQGREESFSLRALHKTSVNWILFSSL